MNVRGISRRRGDPLLILAVVLGAWVLLRAAAWTVWPAADLAAPGPRLAAHEHAPAAGRAYADAAPKELPPPWPKVVGQGLLPDGAGRVFGAPPALDPPGWQAAPLPIVPTPPLPVRQVMPAVAPRLAGGHALLWLAAVGQLPGPQALLEQAGKLPVAPARPSLAGGPSPRRWSADAWALVRGGGTPVGAAPFAPTYGGSQVGAVLRFRLVPTSGHRPTAYVRTNAALVAGGEREVAGGLSLRPMPRLPVVVAAEARVTRVGNATLVRPALMAVTELAPITLPAEARAEFYLQGGFVGGRGATPFVDGSVRIDRQVARLGPVEVRAGAGVWGGAQEGSSRLDIGPTATLGVSRDGAAARLGLDWRLRVAGEAAPASGPALTISAGF